MMKKIVTVIIALLIAAPVIWAQESLRDVVKEYQDQNSEFSLVIPSFLIKMGAAFGDLDEEERELLKHIHNMKIVICEKGFDNMDLPGLKEGIADGQFFELLTVQERDEKVRMIMNKQSSKKSELLMLVEDGSENVLMLFNFYGEPDIQKFISLAD